MERTLNVMIMSGVEDGLVVNCSSVTSENKSTLDVSWTVTIGRREESDVCLRNDTFVSRQHALLHWRGGKWFLEDCGSKNGTYIENSLQEDTQVTDEVPIEPGQLFRVGRTWMRIQPGE